jgi:hypothetical protein
MKNQPETTKSSSRGPTIQLKGTKLEKEIKAKKFDVLSSTLSTDGQYGVSKLI